MLDPVFTQLSDFREVLTRLVEVEPDLASLAEQSVSAGLKTSLRVQGSDDRSHRLDRLDPALERGNRQIDSDLVDADVA